MIGILHYLKDPTVHSLLWGYAGCMSSTVVAAKTRMGLKVLSARLLCFVLASTFGRSDRGSGFWASGFGRQTTSLHYVSYETQIPHETARL